jgi:hypothetical protein
LTKKEALQLLHDAVKLGRVEFRIRTIREAFDIYYEIVTTPLWKRALKRIFKSS